jgi:hypothetical protein
MPTCASYGFESGLTGVWQHTLPGVLQRSARFNTDGTIEVVEASYEEQECYEMSGTYIVTGAGLTIYIDTETVQLTWSLDGDELSLIDLDPEGEGLMIWSPIEDLPTCADYGFAGPGTPGHATGFTDSSGMATLSLLQHSVQVTVYAGGNPAFGASVEIYQGTSLAIVWAELAGFYGNFQLLNLHEISGDPVIDIHLIAEGIEYFVYPDDPALFGLLYGDPAFSAHCQQGSLLEIWTLAQDWGIPYVVLRAYAGGAALREGDITVGFEIGGLSWEAFEQLAFGFFGYLPEDTVEFCYYILEIGAESYLLPSIHIGTIVDQGAAYDYKFILTWGEVPQDLDSHLWTPMIEGNAHHVYFANPGSVGSPPYAWLDVDDVTSYGPEVVTIEQLFPGTYQYAVYEWGGDQTLTESQAVVEVFRGRDRIGVYTVPTTPQAGDNWWWHVGDIDGVTGIFTPVNTLSPDPPQAEMAGPMPAQKLR